MVKRKWIKEEDDFLKDNFKRGNAEWCAEQLGRTKNSIHSRCKVLGLDGTRKYTDKDIKWLKRNYRQHGVEYCAKHFGISKEAVVSLAMRNGCRTGRYMTEKQRKYVDNNIGIKSYEEIAKKVCKTKGAVIAHAGKTCNTMMYNDNNTIVLAEVNRLLGFDRGQTMKRWTKRGLKCNKVNKIVLVNIDDLLEFMQENPNKWNALKCETWFFENYDWFKEKRKSDTKLADEKRWGKFYQVV